MALLNKTGITNGAAIEAEHVTRTIDALTGVSTDTVIASGSFTGSFTGLANSASYAVSASHLIGGGGSVPAGTVSGSAQLIEYGAAMTASSVIFTNASASFISASQEIHAQQGYKIAGGYTLAAGLPLMGSVDLYVGPASDGKLNFQATNTKVDNPFTASSHISASGTITMATASIGGGVFTSASLAAGGAGFPFVGAAEITGSLIVSSSGAGNQALSLKGSGSTQFDVIGSVGTLFSVDDDLSSMLFSVNDLSGLPTLQASASGEVFLGAAPQSLYTTAVIASTTAGTTHSLCTLSTSSYDGAFFEYTAVSESNARAGNIMSVWNNTLVFTETTTTDIGNTSDLTTKVIISGSTARLVAYGANASYKIKTIIKAI